MQIPYVVRGALAGVLLFGGLACAQTKTPLRFDVATIKPHPPGDTASRINLVDGGVDATNVTLMTLLRQVYGVQEYQIQGAPKWVTDARWDLQARTPDFALTVSESSLSGPERIRIRQQMIERMRSLLVDRFQLETHEETKEQSIYSLVVAKGGPRLAATQSNNLDSVNMRGNGGRNEATFTGATMDTVARSLSSWIGRPVVNNTALTGNYDLKLEWVSDLGQARADQPTDAEGPAIFTALPEQTGLRLESQKGPVRIVVIDKVEKPSEN